MPSLFADYLGYVRGAPPSLERIARSHIQLMRLASEHFVPPYSWHSEQTLNYWERYVKIDPDLRAWVSSPVAFRAPESWWPDCPLRGVVTPFEFARDVLPKSLGADARPYNSSRYVGWALGVRGLPLLAAYAHGWPLTRREEKVANDVATELLHSKRFLLWAVYDMSHIPRPFVEDQPTEKTARYRDRFVTNPLNFHERYYKWVLPSWAHSLEAIMAHGMLRSAPLRSPKSFYLLDSEGHRVTWPE